MTRCSISVHTSSTWPGGSRGAASSESGRSSSTGFVAASSSSSAAGLPASTWPHDRAWRESILVTDGRGKALDRYEAGGLRRRLRARLARRDALVASLAAQLEAFGDAVRGKGGSGFLATAADGRATMEALDAVRRSSSEDGSWILVPAREAS